MTRVFATLILGSPSSLMHRCTLIPASRIVRRPSGFNQSFHTRQILIHLGFRIGAKHCCNRMSHSTRDRVVRQSYIHRVLPSALDSNRTIPSCWTRESGVVFQPMDRFGTYSVLVACHSTGAPAGPATIQRDCFSPVSLTSRTFDMKRGKFDIPTRTQTPARPAPPR